MNYNGLWFITGFGLYRALVYKGLWFIVGIWSCTTFLQQSAPWVSKGWSLPAHLRRISSSETCPI